MRSWCSSLARCDGHQFQRPSSTTTDGHEQRADEEGVHQDAGGQAEADRVQLAVAGARAADDREHREGPAEDDAGRGDGRAGAGDRAHHRLAAAAAVRASSRIRVITRML